MEGGRGLVVVSVSETSSGRPGSSELGSAFFCLSVYLSGGISTHMIERVR